LDTAKHTTMTGLGKVRTSNSLLLDVVSFDVLTVNKK